MKLLLNDRRLIVAISNYIEYGVWGNVGSAESWKISSCNYVMDNGYSVVDIGDQEIPSYVNPDEYYYIDGEFRLADECPNEYRDRIITVEDDLINTQMALVEQYEENMKMADSLAQTEENLLDTQLALTEQYEYNLVLEEDLINTQLALVEQFEANISLESRVQELEKLIAALAN